MSLYISLLNNMAVSFLGGILSASFCNALSTRKRKLIFIGCMVLLPLIQSILYFSKGADLVRHIYPLAVHLPLVIVLWMLTGKLLWSVFLYRRHTCAANLEDGLHLPQFKCTEEIQVPGTELCLALAFLIVRVSIYLTLIKIPLASTIRIPRAIQPLRLLRAWIGVYPSATSLPR